MSGKPVNVKQVLVYLTPKQHGQLQELKDKIGCPMSESIRRAVELYLKTMEAKR